MNLNCETIISENEKLKLTDLDKSCINIYEYLKLHHKIDSLKIDISEKDKNENLFCCNVNDFSLVNSLKFQQNNHTIIHFHFLSKEQETFETVKENLNPIKMCLQIFSQSLFNKYMEKTLNEISIMDQLTGAYNRCYLDNYAKNLLSLANREQKKIAFIKIGIDQFKAVIDEFDYEVGDKVLKSLANCLKNNIRESDLVVKISNDEFLVILLNIINGNNAILIAEKLINSFSNEKVIVNEQTNQILMKTICSGISIYPDNASTLDEIMKKSDAALCEARNKGRGQIFIFDDEEMNRIDFF